MASFGWLFGSWGLLDLGLERQRGEKIELGRQARRHRQIEMTKGDPGQHAAAWGALDKTLLDQVGLDNLLDDVALVPERRRYRLHPDWAACVVFGNAAQVTPIHAVETTPIDVKPQQRGIGDGGTYIWHTPDRGNVANPTQQAHRNPRSTAGAARYLGSTVRQ
jgi:hypothetical protein